MNKNSLIKDNIFSRKLLGEILWEAGLIGLQQIELALKDQQDYHNLKIGEIFSLHGWIKEETVNFFVEDWPNILQNEEKYHPIGFYLKRANLLTDEEINFIIQQQKIKQEKFGLIAISNGFLKESTINYFLENIKPIQEKLKLSLTQNNLNNDDITFVEKPTQIIENIKPISEKFKKLSLTQNNLDNDDITFVEQSTQIIENINQTLIQKDTIITSKKIVIIPSSKPQLIKCNNIYYSAISIDY